MAVRAYITGLADATRAFDRLAARYTRENMAKQLRRAYNEANVTYTPIVSGRLRASMRVRLIGKALWRVTWEAPYAAFVEQGTSRTPPGFVGRVSQYAIRRIKKLLRTAG